MGHSSPFRSHQPAVPGDLCVCTPPLCPDVAVLLTGERLGSRGARLRPAGSRCPQAGGAGGSSSQTRGPRGLRPPGRGGPRFRPGSGTSAVFLETAGLPGWERVCPGRGARGAFPGGPSWAGGRSGSALAGGVHNSSPPVCSAPRQSSHARAAAPGRARSPPKGPSAERQCCGGWTQPPDRPSPTVLPGHHDGFRVRRSQQPPRLRPPAPGNRVLRNPAMTFPVSVGPGRRPGPWACADRGPSRAAGISCARGQWPSLRHQ